MTTLNPPRPTVTDDMVRTAAAPVAAKLDGDVETIVKAYRYGMDGYELARELDNWYGWTVRREDLDVLDEVEYDVDRLLQEAQQAWVETHNIQPPFPIGARVACQVRRAAGVIDGICQHRPATYLVKPDGHDDDVNGYSRWVCPFEKVNLIEDRTE